MTTTTLHLDLTVTYDLNGEDPKAMKDMLHQMVFRAIGDGMLTGNTDAEVDEYSMDVATAPDDQLDAIMEHLQAQLESGNLKAESLAHKLASYGLMPVTDFLDEMKERGAITQD